ncbi:MAG: hypothetical protein ACI85I_002620 [Arenicella sp.]|jgi:hypothetical protein
MSSKNQNGELTSKKSIAQNARLNSQGYGDQRILGNSFGVAQPAQVAERKWINLERK